jgi:hypothetical protein
MEMSVESGTMYSARGTSEVTISFGVLLRQERRTHLLKTPQRLRNAFQEPSYEPNEPLQVGLGSHFASPPPLSSLSSPL